MKKYVLLCLMAGLNLSLMAEDYENYKLNINGEIEAVIKSQDKFSTPFDYVDWGWATRGGSSEKDSQFARVQGNVTFSSGTLGMSEYFGALTLTADPQSSNDNVELRNSQLGNTTWTQFEKNKVEVSNAFLMWRPWAVKDKNGNLIGRPIGITVGNQSIPATVNAVNTNIFKGDIDGDYIGYSSTSLMNKPGVHLDFHTGKFGVGYAYLKGSSDLLNNSAGYTNERSRTQVVYADADLMGLKGNIAYQLSDGNRKSIDSLSQVQNYFGNNTLSIDNDDYAYSGTAINMSLAYSLKLGKESKLTPFVGYQKTDTEVAPDIIVETANKVYGSNFNIQKVEAEFTTIGTKYETTMFGKKIKLAGEYSKCDMPEAQGLDLVYDGQIDYAVAKATGGTYKMETGAFKGIAGNGKATYTLAGLDAMGQVDVTVEMNKNVDVTLFYKTAKAKDVNYKVTDAQKSAIANVMQTALGMSAPVAAGTAAALADNIESGIKTSTKWEDYNSIGVSMTYKF